MRVAFHNYDGKGTMLAEALEAAGHTLVADCGDVAVVDWDWRDVVHRHPRTVVYPHGGNPLLCWDGVFDVHPHVVMQLTHSAGHAEVLKAYGYPARVEPVGWCYSEVRPWRRPSGRRILFAPAHAGGHGYFDPRMRDLNLRALASLRGRAYTVRVRGSLRAHGLQPTGRVHQAQGGGLGHADIDAADFVLAEGTVAHLAAARGAPLIYMGSALAPDQTSGAPGDEPTYPARWGEYKHLVRHPVDFDDADLDELLERASRPGGEVAAWLERWVQPFDARRAVRLIEEAAGMDTREAV